MLMVGYRWDDWVPQERLRKLTDENRELAQNLKKDMDAQRRAASGRPPPPPSNKKRPFGSDLTGSSARGSEDRSSAAPQFPRGTKRGRDVEGIDKVSCCSCFVPSFSVEVESPRVIAYKNLKTTTIGSYKYSRQSRCLAVICALGAARHHCPAWHLILQNMWRKCQDSRYRAPARSETTLR